jgi:hypothetical protein
MNRLFINFVSLSFLLALLIGSGQSAYAYDGDVDYSAPYMTLDPETGKLVTIDPTAESAPPPQHQAGQSTPMTVTANNPGANTSVEITEAQAFPPLAVVAIVIIALIAIGIATVRRKKGLSSSRP